MYKKTELANGLKIVSCRMPTMQSVALGIWINVGGRYESQHNKGISHYLEHLLFKGSKKYSCRKIKESIEGIGGSLNGFTSEELTCYLVKAPHRHLRQVLDILSDMVIDPVLPAVEIEKERTVILEEIKMYKDQPQIYVYEILDELLWPKQPLGAPIIGTVESVSSVTRQRLSEFKNNYYTPSNIVVSAAGLFEYSDLNKAVSGIFSGLKRREKNLYQPVSQKQDKPQLKLMHKETEQTHLALGFHGFNRDHPSKYALGLLHVILGGNMSSRLFNELREKRGLAYEIGTQTKRFHDTGAFVVHAGIDNRRVLDAVELILNELHKAKHTLVTADELKRAKEFYLGQMMLALEDTLDHMLWIGETTAALDKVYELEEIIKQVRRVKAHDIREVAGLLFSNDRINLALIGPKIEKESTIYNHLRIN